MKFGKPADNKGFKFYIEEDGSYPFYGQKIGGEFGQIQTFAIANDGDSQFYPLQYDYTSGIYPVSVDLNTMMLTLTRTGDVTEFDPESALYILGDNMENGWEMVEANALLPVGENIYENTRIYLKPESSFKFDFYDWTEYIRDEAAGEYWTLKKKGDGDGDIRFIPGDQGFSEGYYTVRVDLNTLKVTLTGGTAPAYPETLFLFGPATEAGWNLGSFIPLTKTGNGVFQVKGVNIDVGTANPDDNKGNGFKFGISNSDWLTEYGAKEAFDDHDGQQGYRGWELAQNSNQFYPLLMGYASGTYDITVDFTTMAVRFEPAQGADYPGRCHAPRLGSEPSRRNDPNLPGDFHRRECPGECRHGTGRESERQRIQVHHLEHRVAHGIRCQRIVRRWIHGMGTRSGKQSVLSPVDGIRKRQLPDHGGPHDHDSPIRSDVTKFPGIRNPDRR